MPSAFRPGARRGSQAEFGPRASAGDENALSDDHEPPHLVTPWRIDREQVHARFDVLAVARDQVPGRFAVALGAIVIDLLHEIAGERVDLDARLRARQPEEVDVAREHVARDLLAIPGRVRPERVRHHPHAAVAKRTARFDAGTHDAAEQRAKRTLEQLRARGARQHDGALRDGGHDVMVIEAVEDLIVHEPIPPDGGLSSNTTPLTPPLFAPPDIVVP